MTYPSFIREYRAAYRHATGQRPPTIMPCGSKLYQFYRGGKRLGQRSKTDIIAMTAILCERARPKA